MSSARGRRRRGRGQLLAFFAPLAIGFVVAVSLAIDISLFIHAQRSVRQAAVFGARAGAEAGSILCAGKGPSEACTFETSTYQDQAKKAAGDRAKLLMTEVFTYSPSVKKSSNASYAEGLVEAKVVEITKGSYTYSEVQVKTIACFQFIFLSVLNMSSSTECPANSFKIEASGSALETLTQ